MPIVLIVDDEKDIADVVQYNLEKEGFKTICARDGHHALKLVYNTPPDLIILDQMLPVMNGLELCRLLKRDAKTSGIPIIFLTVKNEEVDKIVGLELGADDYITKPFSPRELVARVRVVLRRGNKVEDHKLKPVIVAGDLTIDTLKHEITVKNKCIKFTVIEFKILELLVSAPNVLFTRNKILDSVWAQEAYIEPRTIDVHIKKIRHKLDKEIRQQIVAVRGMGYKFQSKDK